jgi:hypothetical protein
MAWPCTTAIRTVVVEVDSQCYDSASRVGMNYKRSADTSYNMNEG